MSLDYFLCQLAESIALPPGWQEPASLGNTAFQPGVMLGTWAVERQKALPRAGRPPWEHPREVCCWDSWSSRGHDLSTLPVLFHSENPRPPAIPFPGSPRPALGQLPPALQNI